MLDEFCKQGVTTLINSSKARKVDKYIEKEEKSNVILEFSNENAEIENVNKRV